MQVREKQYTEISDQSKAVNFSPCKTLGSN